jgi:hypothetical protein
LCRQCYRLLAWATSSGMPLSRIYKSIGSAYVRLNERLTLRLRLEIITGILRGERMVKTRIERWVPKQGREDVSTFLNDYASLRRVLAQAPTTSERRPPAPIRVADLLEAGLLKPGDVIHTRKQPDLCATVVNARFVEYEGRQWRYTEWGTHVTEWSAINIYPQFVLAHTGQTLDELRKQLRQGCVHRQGWL